MPQVKTKIITAQKSSGISVKMNPILKAQQRTSNPETASHYSAMNTFVTPMYKATSLRRIVESSTIIPQCSKAYSQNIAGFGFATAFAEDPGSEEPSAEQEAEAKALQETLMLMSLDMPTKELFEKVLKDREEVGSGYVEVERDGMGLPARLYYMEPEYIEISKVSRPISTTTIAYGRKIQTLKRFRTFRQKVSAINGSSIVYFKEFGDPRMIDNRSGKEFGVDQEIEDQFIANEILQFKTGAGVYGTPRWIGQVTHIEGSRMAEMLNYKYFTDGRHVNMAIVVEGGTLTKDSYDQVQDYMNNIKGVDNAHKTLLLEMDSATGSEVDLSDGKIQKPSVKIEKMNDLLQGDGLFLQYTDESRQKVQSSFNLPDIYVGRSRDYNFATAKAAIDVTERQVFVPERESLEWQINHKLLAPYMFKHVSVKLKPPTITDQEFQIQFFNAASAAGGVTPDDARKLLEKVFNIELQAFDEDWSKLPLPVLQLLQSAISSEMDTENSLQKDAPIEKQAKSQKLYSLLSEVKKALSKTETTNIEY